VLPLSAKLVPESGNAPASGGCIGIATQLPISQRSPLGHVAPVHGSPHVPAMHTVPGMQVTVAHAVSSQRPLVITQV
jgi:hypothetical protein